MLRHAAERLGKLDPGNKSAIAALVLLMQQSPHPSTIWKAASSLMAIDPKNSALPPSLITLIKKLPAHSRNLRKIAEAIIQIDPNYPTLIPTLIAIAQKLPSHFCLLRDAVEVLGKVGEGNETVIDALIRLTEITPEQLLDNDFYFDSSEWLRKLAAESLSKIAVGNEKVIAALIRLIAMAKKPCSPLMYDDTRSYWKAVDALGKIAVRNESAIATLTEIVQTHSDVMIRYVAAASLSKIDLGNKTAISILSQALEELPKQFLERSQTTLENRSLLWLIADCLIETDDYREDAIAALQDTLLKFDNCPDSCACLSSLARIDSTYELAIETVFQLLRSSIVCSALFVSTISPNCIYCLGNYLKDTPKMYLQDNAIAELTKFIQKSWNCENLSNFDYLFSVAAITLQKIDPGNPIVVSTLIRLIEARDPIDLLQHSIKNTSIYSYCNLAEIGASDRIFVDKIVECFEAVLPEENRPFHYLVHRELSLIHLAEMLTQSQLEIPESSLSQLARSLLPYIREPLDENLSHYCDCYDAGYQIVWYCASKMSYSAFYFVWQE
ncbi:HEAT repeat domain-containing protein [Lusitaniella coriacea]|uniref:HEAT repeat domain-containing protein n=1 Tax=Lusitaniella coriacea TaxID=1983105 RepID=UPI003CF7C79F